MKPVLAAALLIAAALPAGAGELRPLHGQTIDLGAVQGVAYYTVEADDAYALVATFASEGSTPLRVAANLSDGDSLTITVPVANGDVSPNLDIVREGSAVRISGRIAATH